MSEHTHDLDAATSRSTERAEGFLSPRVLQREAAKVLAARGYEVRPAVMRRLIDGFVNSGETRIDDYISRLGHADPTAIDAIRNAEPKRGGRR